ncbi:MAG: DUF3750 domain-containing protein [Alphaproteobacteria bacterium]|nr:MAG: DUF3750 domain-containing protein [Alphaproteobacteria bacterium]
MVFTLLALFLLPVAARAALFAYDNGPRSWRDADWSSSRTLPAAADYTPARVLVMNGQTGGWKGTVAVHSWIVLKREGARSWTRYDVVGWGNPVRTNGWAPDGLWYGNKPTVLVDISGAQATALIPRVEDAVKRYQFANAGDYRVWPGPNSNTFVATVLRAVPELGVTMPPNAIGRDYRPYPYLGLSDSGTGIEASLWGVLGMKMGWVEGIEVNVLGLVAGVDLRRPAVKLPGFGRIGLEAAVARAASPGATPR